VGSTLFDFTWSVDEEGYSWGELPAGLAGSSDPARYHCVLKPAEVSVRVRQYQPLHDFTGLFRTFAAILPGPEGEGIIAFANRFGPLGSPPMGFRLTAPGMDLPQTPDTWDLVGIWLLAIDEMNELVSLWDLVQKGDRSALSQLIQWQGRNQIYYHTWPNTILGEGGKYGDQHLIFSPEHHGQWLRQFTPGDVLMPALVYVQRRVNYWIEAAASPKLRWDATKARTELVFIPGSLLGALWLQFARAIEGNRSYRQCKECGQWFEVSPETARTSRLFCSGPCRSKAYRGRQERAKELHDKGWSVKKIATELESDIPTVRRWLDK
jgi:hypothetical protein